MPIFSVETAACLMHTQAPEPARNFADRSWESEKQSLIPDTQHILKSHFILFPPPISSALFNYICSVSNTFAVDFFFRT